VSLLLATPAVIFWSSSYQNITAGVANSSFVLSLYTVPTVQSQTAINHILSLFSSQFSSSSSLSTFTQHLPSLVQTLWRTQRTQLSSSHITQENFSFKPLGWNLETNLAACSVIAKSWLLNYAFKRLWTILLTAILGQTAITNADSHCLSRIRVLALGLAHNTACLLALPVMWTTAAGMKCAGCVSLNLIISIFFLSESQSKFQDTDHTKYTVYFYIQLHQVSTYSSHSLLYIFIQFIDILRTYSKST